MNRITHFINSECEIFITRVAENGVRIRIAEKDTSLSDPTDFEIEGNPAYIAEAFASLASVLKNLDQILKEPS